MKRIWFLITIILSGVLLVWCNKQVLERTITTDDVNNDIVEDNEYIPVEERTKKLNENKWDWVDEENVHQIAWLKTLDNWIWYAPYSKFLSSTNWKIITFNSSSENWSLSRFAIYDRENHKWLFDCFENNGWWYITINNDINISKVDVINCEQKYNEIMQLIGMQTKKDSNITPNKGDLLTIDELKTICVNKLKEAEPANLTVARMEEKLFINTYWFKWVAKSKWMHNWSPVYCNIDLNGNIISDWFFHDQWQTIDFLHSDMDFNNPWWIRNDYPNLESFYWFIWNIIFWGTTGSKSINGDNNLYYNSKYWFALWLGKERNWWLIHEEYKYDIYDSYTIIFYIQDNNIKTHSWIDGYKEIFTIRAIDNETFDLIKEAPDLYSPIVWKNNKYYFSEIKNADTPG